jgi:hypothetical protein
MLIDIGWLLTHILRDPFPKLPLAATLDTATINFDDKLASLIA